MRQPRTPHLLLLVTLLLIPLPVSAQRNARSPKLRAKPPEFNPDDFEGVFFSNLFEEGLVGKRPDKIQRKPPQGNGPRPGPNEGPGNVGSSAEYAWSKIISASTLEDEVKSLKLKVDQDVTTPAKFAGRGYKASRKNFSTLALVFAIVGEYDGDVRWKEDAPLARDYFARAAANCKVGSQQAFNEAKLRKQDLQDLIGGSSLSGTVTPAAAKWDTVVDRNPLMQRLESAIQDKLQPMTASKSEFSANNDQVLHEAEFVAAISEVLLMDGMDDADDQDYLDYTKRMKQAALEVVAAVKTNDHNKATSAVGRINKSCSECHETYR